jgi:hypothetical protein
MNEENIMSKQALVKIIEQQNFWRKFREQEPLDIDTLTTEQANDIYEGIDIGLSPENLHCDGEITRAQAVKKFNVYMQAVEELQKRGFPIPADCYEIG